MRPIVLITILMMFFPVTALAQGVPDGSIVPDTVEIQEDECDVDAETLQEWADNAREAADASRVLVEPTSVMIIRLGERSTVMTDAIDQTLIDNQERLADLRNAFQINAVLVEILNAYGVGIPEIVGANVTDEGAVTLHAFAEQR